MKYKTKVAFKCDNCKKSVNNKKHVRFQLSMLSGWMFPPFIGGYPVSTIVDRNTDFHFCKPECLAMYFVDKLNEIADTRKDIKKSSKPSARGTVLESTVVSRPYMRGEANTRTRNRLFGQKGKRGVVHNSLMRQSTLHKFPLRERGNHRQEDKPLDRVESDSRLGRGGQEVSKKHMATGVGLFKRIVRGLSL